MIFSDSAYLSYKEEIQKIAKMSKEREKTTAKKGKKKKKEYDPKSAYGKFNKYFVPALGSAVSGGTMGASLAGKGNRLKGFKRGAGGGVAGSLLWHATTRGYSKGMDIPYKEVVASAKKPKQKSMPYVPPIDPITFLCRRGYDIERHNRIMQQAAAEGLI